MFILKNNLLSSWPKYSQEEAEAISKVLLSNKVNYWTGDEIKCFENEFSNFVKTKYAIALANGTVAIDAALKSMGLGEGDEVIVTSRTFIASVSAIVNAGAIPIFADVDIDTQNITSQTIEDKITNNTKAIICVHLAGWPCDMDPILQLATKNNLWVIEDCAQAHGAVYKGKHVGSIGHIGCWSFCQDKIITTGGEGGMITTNDYTLWKKIWSLKDHGKNWDSIHSKKISQGFRWVHDSFGTNWRMTELQATIGRIQLRKLPEWTTKRNQNAEAIWSSASKLPNIRVPKYRCGDCLIACTNGDACINACYKCYIFVQNGKKNFETN